MLFMSVELDAGAKLLAPRASERRRVARTVHPATGLRSRLCIRRQVERQTVDLPVCLFHLPSGRPILPSGPADGLSVSDSSLGLNTAKSIHSALSQATVSLGDQSGSQDSRVCWLRHP